MNEQETEIGTLNVYEVKMLCVIDGNDEFTSEECEHVLAPTGDDALATVRNHLTTMPIPWSDEDEGGTQQLSRYTSCELAELKRVASDVLVPKETPHA